MNAKERKTVKSIIDNGYGKIMNWGKLSTLEEAENYVFMLGQRSVKQNSVSLITEAMLNGTFSDRCVKVFDVPDKNGKYEVADGQHRLLAWKDALAKGYKGELDVAFISTPPTLMERIQLVQSLNRGSAWLAYDRFSSNADIESVDGSCNGHKEVLNFCLKTKGYLMNGCKKNIRYACAIMLDGDYVKQAKANDKQDLELPAVFVNNDFSLATEMYENIIELADVLQIKGSVQAGLWFEPLARALRYISYENKDTSDKLGKLGVDKFFKKIKESHFLPKDEFTVDTKNKRKIEYMVEQLKNFLK